MNIAVIGAGGWGTALAGVLAQNHHDVLLWSREQETTDSINSLRVNNVYLPGIELPKGITATCKPEAIADATMVVIAVPTQHIRSAIVEHKFPLRGKIVVNVSKGIEKSTTLRISQILHQVAAVSLDSYAVLTGPSHAEEVARNIPTTVVVASYDEEVAKTVQKAFMTSFFRVYYSRDVIGAELAGALKNIIAISSGILDGMNIGDNPKAALMTRGLAEMARLGQQLGANPQTFSGLAGMGDLIVTCSSKHSRNRFVGEQIGQGKTLREILSEMKQIAEGVPTTESVLQLSKKLGVEMPIVEQVYDILYNEKDPRLAIQDLMERKSKAEYWM